MSELQIQVTEGRAWEAVKKLTTGTPLGPMGVGSAAEWVIDGPGVSPVHAYFYYDGTVLMVATAPPSVTTLNGTQVGGDWIPVKAPAEVKIGGVRLQVNYNEADFEDAATTNTPPKEINEDAATAFIDKSTPAGRPPGPTAGRRPPPENESTAFMPIEQMRKGEPSSPAAPVGGAPAVVVSPEAYQKRPDPSKIAMTIAPGLLPTPQIEPPPQPPAQQKPQAQAPPKPGFWASASLPRKLTILLAPIALIGFASTLFDEDPPPQKAPKKTASSGSAVASSSAPPPSPIGALPDLPTGPLLPAPPRDSGAKKPPFPPNKPPPPTLERKAVDAAIAGNYAEAIGLYEQLAQQNPQVPIYKEAIRILKAKQGAK